MKTANRIPRPQHVAHFGIFFSETGDGFCRPHFVFPNFFSEFCLLLRIRWQMDESASGVNRKESRTHMIVRFCLDPHPSAPRITLKVFVNISKEFHFNVAVKRRIWVRA